MLGCEVVALLAFSSIDIVIFLNIVSNSWSFQVSGSRNNKLNVTMEQVSENANNANKDTL